MPLCHVEKDNQSLIFRKYDKKEYAKRSSESRETKRKEI
jgi:hypothetical protein